MTTTVFVAATTFDNGVSVFVVGQDSDTVHKLAVTSGAAENTVWKFKKYERVLGVELGPIHDVPNVMPRALLIGLLTGVGLGLICGAPITGAIAGITGVLSAAYLTEYFPV